MAKVPELDGRGPVHYRSRKKERKLQHIQDIRTRIREGKIHDVELTNPHLFQRALEGEYLNLQPPVQRIADLILYYQPPEFPDSVVGAEMFGNQPGTIPQLPLADILNRKSQVFVNSCWEVLNWFYAINFKLNDELGVETTLRKINKFRFAANFKTALQFLIDGYGQGLRNTGEPIALHPMRIFLRHRSDGLLTKRPQDLWISYTSWLASLLHDCKEDKKYFKDFQFFRSRDSFMISFTDRENHKWAYPLEISEEEATLLYLQIDALTVPELPPSTPEEVKSKAQFDHLENAVRKIADRFGYYAAFNTLLIKWYDRLDNLFTYWEKTPDGKVVVKNPLRKIRETITFFRRIEELANIYLRAYSHELYYRFVEKQQATVRFCQYLLLGGSYNEAFSDNLTEYKNLLRRIKDEPHDTQKFIHLVNLLLIPTLYPGEYASATMVDLRGTAEEVSLSDPEFFKINPRILQFLQYVGDDFKPQKIQLEYNP